MTKHILVQGASEATELPVSVIRNEDGLFIVSTDTGEILEQQLKEKEPTKAPPINVISKYVGIDTRFPDQARDAQELIEAAAVHDPFLYQLNVVHSHLLDLLEKSLKAPELLVYRYICEHLTARNYWFGSMTELAEAFPTLSLSGLYQILKILEGSFIRRCNKGSRGLVILKVHPWYAFRGARYFKASALQDWCKSQAAPPPPLKPEKRPD